MEFVEFGELGKLEFGDKELGMFLSWGVRS